MLPRSLSRITYPRGTVPFVQGKTRVGYLYMLQKGAAERYYEEKGAKKMRDLLSEGDLYGGISMLLNDGLAVRTMEVIEDATFCVLPSHVFFELCEKYSVFSDFFSDTFGKRMLSRSYAAIIAKTLHPQEDSLQFFNQPLSQIYSRNPVFCDADRLHQGCRRYHGAARRAAMRSSVRRTRNRWASSPKGILPAR